MKVRGKKIPVRLPLPPKQGGAMKAKKGGYNRERDRKKPIREGRSAGIWEYEIEVHDVDDLDS